MKWMTTMLAGVAALAISITASAAAADNPYLTLDELRAKFRDPAGRTFSTEGVEVYYKDEGRGPVILLIHGSVSTLKTYDGVASRLARRYRVIRFDIPPAGLSGPVSDAAAARLRPIDIPERLLAHLGVAHATVVGVSSGGTLGAYMAADRPDLVERLILSNTPSDRVDSTPLKMTPDFIEVQKEAAREHFQSRRFWTIFLTFFAGEPARMTPAIIDHYYDFNRRMPEPHALDLVAKVSDHEKAVAAFGKVTAPTLLIWGARDPLLPPHAAEVLTGYMSRAQVSKILLPDVGHYPPLEVPDRFADLVESYVRTVPGAAPTP